MPNPWEKYAAPVADTGGPWAKYGAPPPAAPAEQPPGAASRFGTSTREALGIPANPIEDLTGGLQFSAEHPAEAAKQLALSPIEGYKAAVSQQYDRMHAAYERGDYGQALIHGLYYLLSPVGGANLGKAAEQIKAHDYAGAAGTTVGTAVPIAAGSPEVRAAAGTAANAGRSAVATGLKKSAPTVSTVATVAGAAHELMEGRPWSAATVAALGKPGITKTMTSLADFIRPGENGIQPLPKSFATIHSLVESLKAPGIDGEAPAAAAPPAGAPSYFETGATPKTTVPLTKVSGRVQMLQDLRDFEVMNRAVNEMNAQTGMGQDEILAEMQRAGGTWRGKGSAPIKPEEAVYLKSAKNGLPSTASDQEVAAAATKLKYQDEHMAEVLQDSIAKIQAKKAAAAGGKTETTATAEGRGVQAEAARAGSKYMNPSPKGKGTAAQGIEETPEGARLIRERAERDAKRKGTLGEMR